MNKGFTLVELMVVISIIAILSVVGMVVYSKVQKNTRDARRHADIDAIASALEVKHNETNSYAIVSETEFGSKYFGSGTIPAPPEGGSYTKITSDNGFIVCAKLEDNDSSGCANNSSTCYCQRSLYGVLGAGDSGIAGLPARTKWPLANDIGDIDGNGLVTGYDERGEIYQGSDVWMVNQIVASPGSYTDDQKRRADINGTGGVTSLDALCLMRYLNNLGPTNGCPTLLQP